MTMTEASRKVHEFTQHLYLGILATVYPSGGPQAFPMWYEYDGHHFSLASEAGAAKVRNVLRNRNVALCVTDTSRQIRSLTVIGQAEVLADNRQAQELHRKLAVRYMGLEEGDQWADSMADEDMVVIRISPEKFLWTG